MTKKAEFYKGFERELTPLIKDILDYSLSIRTLRGLQASQPFTRTEMSLSEPLPVNRGGDASSPGRGQLNYRLKNQSVKETSWPRRASGE